MGAPVSEGVPFSREAESRLQAILHSESQKSKLMQIKLKHINQAR